MANEISASLSLSVRNGTLSKSFDKNVSWDQTTALAELGDQIVGTAAEVLDVGDITLGAAALYNRDSTNYVEIGIDQSGTFVPVLKLPAGHLTLIEPASGVSLYMRANTAPVTIEPLLVNT